MTLDPALAEDGASLRVLCNTMEGLVGYDGSGRLQNFLAEASTVSPDGKRYEFTLRKEARWSDGKAVTAADFVTGSVRALTPQSGSKLAGMLFPIRGAKGFYEGKQGPDTLAVRDEHGKLVIELEQAAPYFIQVLTLPVALPERRDVLEANAGRWPESAPVTGPYRITQHLSERLIHFEKNPYYWAPSSELVPVEMVIVADEATGLNLFEQGDLDILTKIGSTDLPGLRKRHGVVHTAPYLATYYLAFNFKKPPFNDRIWRQAVAGAIRRIEVVKILDAGRSSPKLGAAGSRRLYSLLGFVRLFWPSDG